MAEPRKVSVGRRAAEQGRWEPGRWEPGRWEPGASEPGFTLAEMLAALAILLIGVTTLLASLTSSVGLRRSTEARLAIAHAVEDVVLQVRQNGLRQRDGGTVLDLEVSLPGPVAVPGFPGAAVAVRAIDDPRHPDLLLLELTATWLEAGEMIQERFLRVLPRQLPLGARVQRFQNEVPR